MYAQRTQVDESLWVSNERKHQAMADAVTRLDADETEREEKPQNRFASNLIAAMTYAGISPSQLVNRVNERGKLKLTASRVKHLRSVGFANPGSCQKPEELAETCEVIGVSIRSLFVESDPQSIPKDDITQKVTEALQGPCKAFLLDAITLAHNAQVTSKLNRNS